MTLPEYLADLAREMRSRSASMRRDFATHRLSGGQNREELVGKFLREHLPTRFGVDTGLVITPTGEFSNQADLIVVDHSHNAPLHGSSSNKLWPVESVYAIVEVKSSLSPSDMRETMAKCRRFKRLARSYLTTAEPQRQSESLFVLWAFDCPESTTVKSNLVDAASGFSRAEQIDLVVVPDRLVARSGQYLELSRLGHPRSEHRTMLQAQYGPDLEGKLLPDAVEVDEFGDDSLMAWFVWFDSWLRHAGSRSCDPIKYLPPDRIWGRRV